MIRNWQYLPEYERDRANILATVDRVFSSGRLIMGQEVETFERDFAAYCGAAHGIGVNSGTDALFLALKALGVGEGDEVVTVSNTAVPTVAAIRAAGAVPVFVDVEEDSYLMDVTKLEDTLTSRTRCLLPVHLCGQAVDMEPLLEIAAARGIPVVEDCAQATGALYRGKPVGGIGDVGAFSFYPTKILGAFGDGGMAVTSNALHAERLRSLRFYGMKGAYYAEEEGYNSRLDEVQAALLNCRLGTVNASVDRRREIARIYAEGLTGIGDIAIPAAREGRSHQFYLYTIRTGRRDRLMQYLADRDIEARINYPTPIHLMRGYRFLGNEPGCLPVTERLAGEILSLPMHPELKDEEAAEVIEAIRDFFRQGQAEQAPGGTR